jgi:site-specific recombinase XerD
MTPLREKYVRDLAVRGRAQRTQQAYAGYVADLARWYHRAPDLITYDEVVSWLHHLIKDRRLAASSVNIAVNAVRFLYAVTLGRDTAPLLAQVPRMKRNTKRAHAYAVSEIEPILRAPARLRDRVFLMTVYSAGLRLSEAIGLRVSDLDGARMQLRVQGKGAKERVCPLSTALLESLKEYWRKERRGQPGAQCSWLFLGQTPDEPMCKATGQGIYYRAVAKSGVRRKGGIHVLRHSFATHLIESGVELTVVQRLLGHSSLLTTARYLHVTAHRLGEIRSALDLIDTGRMSPSKTTAGSS